MTCGHPRLANPERNPVHTEELIRAAAEAGLDIVRNTDA